MLFLLLFFFSGAFFLIGKHIVRVVRARARLMRVVGISITVGLFLLALVQIPVPRLVVVFSRWDAYFGVLCCAGRPKLAARPSDFGLSGQLIGCPCFGRWRVALARPLF